jgi:flagellar basal-body rod protein FlgB
LPGYPWEIAVSGIGLPLVDQLKSKMQWLQARQKVLAENVANADTPRFKPHDLKPMSSPGLGVAIDRTNPAHLGPSAASAGADPKNAKRFETSPSGNSVTLEDEMMKISETQMDFQTVASLYGKSLGLLKIAIGKKG